MMMIIIKSKSISCKELILAMTLYACANAQNLAYKQIIVYLLLENLSNSLGMTTKCVESCRKHVAQEGSAEE